MTVDVITFNDFAENTYILSDDSKECAIVDPGCFTQDERDHLDRFISERGLKPTLLINTHAHLDHVFGVNHVHATYNLPLHLHKGEMRLLEAGPQIAKMYGIDLEPNRAPVNFIEEGEQIGFGNTTLEIVLTPGHSPASVCFFHRDTRQLIAGDVLFQGSIGRTDLPGGDYDTLIGSITDQLFPLGDDVFVYPGHGPATTIEVERKTNPFLIGLV